MSTRATTEEMSCNWELCCENCGSTRWLHFYGPDARGHVRWQNRCLGCRRVGEYLPTREEIRRECEAIRRESAAREAAERSDHFLG